METSTTTVVAQNVVNYLRVLDPLIWSYSNGLTKPFAFLISVFSLMQTAHKDVSTHLKSDSYLCVVLTQSLRPLLILTEANAWRFKEKWWNIEGSWIVLYNSIVMFAEILARFFFYCYAKTSHLFTLANSSLLFSYAPLPRCAHLVLRAGWACLNSTL